MPRFLSRGRTRVIRRSWSGSYATGSVEQALAYSELFWPEFILHEGCVLLERIPDSFPTWTESLGDSTKVEAMLNHRHISDLFHRDASHDVMIRLGRVLKYAWTLKLARDFPDRRFAVEFYDTPSDDPTDYQVTFISYTTTSNQTMERTAGTLDS